MALNDEDMEGACGLLSGDKSLDGKTKNSSGTDRVENLELGNNQDCAQVQKTSKDKVCTERREKFVESLSEHRLSMEERTESDDEDEEDVDFNPFLQCSASPEASSGLSSENEDLDEENGIEGENLENCEKGRFQDARGKNVMELGSEDDNEEVDDNEEEEDEKNDEDGVDGKEVCNVREPWHLKHLVDGNLENLEASTLLQTLCVTADVGLHNGDVVVDTETGCKVKMIVRTEPHQRRSHVLELSNGERTEEETVGCTFAALLDLGSSPRQGKSSIERRRDQSSEEQEQVVDAICKRTRAQYSLADMSLDELETFLQESDEEDYFQNVDDEEEYRKFVAAVQGKWDDRAGPTDQDGGKDGDEDEDEEDDYDFEVEIEEALESDYEEASKREARKRKCRAGGRRLEAREKRRHRARPQIKERLLGLAKTPLRPLLPSMGGKDFGSDTNKILEERSFKGKPGINGFTAHQIGQLYCLIHEHVQLLVQVFSLCILEPSRQQIAIDTHRLLMQLVEKRDLVLAWKKVPFPEFCFCPPYIHASTSCGKSENYLEPLPYKFQDSSKDWKPSFSVDVPTFHSSATSDQSLLRQLPGKGAAVTFQDDVYTHHHADCSPSVSISGTSNENTLSIDMTQLTTASNPCLEQRSSGVFLLSKLCSNSPVHPEISSNLEGYVSQDVLSSSCSAVNLPPNAVASVVVPEMCAPYTSGNKGINMSWQTSSWAPTISGPVYSLLEVAPVALVKEFLADVAQAVQEYRQQHVHIGTYHSECGREPLFLLPVATDCQVAHSDPCPKKKTMAAALVETTKKKSIAPVPKEISAVVNRFTPLFNQALFPHKPPPAATANRLLFTEAEDELLAMGLMTYNTNWKAIQQYFLPSKTTHQIFIRQKNRSSARAPENSIKAVRRLKASPLTKEEEFCIQEGLKLLKNDWAKVWQHCVPYRDPAALPRQWRVAVGIQKSYKNSDEAKAKHRIYEAKRRREKDAARAGLLDGDDGEVNSADEGWEANGVYLHEAFLTDWKPDSCHSTPAILPAVAHPSSISNVCCSESKGNLTTMPCQENSVMPRNVGKGRLAHHSVFGGQSLPVIANAPPACSSAPSVISHNSPSNQTAKEHYQSWSYQAFRKGIHTIKLAPGLPSLNLPPCVRVISQSKLNNGHSLSSNNNVNVFSHHNCLLSTQNQKARLATLPDASGCTSMPLFSPKPQWSFPRINGGKSKRIKDSNIRDQRSIPIVEPESGNTNFSRMAYGHSALENKKASSFIKIAGCHQIPNSHEESISSEKEKDTVMKPTLIKMHPLLMQSTFESGSSSNAYSLQMPNQNVNPGEFQDISPAEQQQLSLRQQQIPQFHPFFGAPLDKGRSTLFVAASCPNESSSVGTAELHPFLQENDEHQPGLLRRVKGTVDPQLYAQRHPYCPFPITRGMMDRGTVQQPSASPDTIIRPEPIRVVQQRQEMPQLGECLNTVHGPKEKNVCFLNSVCDTRCPKTGCKRRVSDDTARKKGKEKIGLLESGAEEININIVMEQEELSDSDEEMVEGVQFEYEEMGDSEREDPDYEQHLFEPDKEDNDIEFEEEEIGSDDSDNDGEMADKHGSSVQVVEDSAIAGEGHIDAQLQGLSEKASLEQSCIISSCSQQMDSESRTNLETSVAKGNDAISKTCDASSMKAEGCQSEEKAVIG